MAACRAGFILLPAWITLPMTTVPTSAPEIPARCNDALMTAAPSSTAGVSLTVPYRAGVAARRDDVALLREQTA